MNRLLLITICVCLSFIANAQISTNFSTPLASSWQGDVSSYTINADNQLQLNSTGTDTAYLAHPFNFNLNTTEFKLWFKLGFAPSANNRFRFFFYANNIDASLATEAFFMQLGENGSADELEFYIRTNGTDVMLYRSTGLDLELGNNPMSIRVLAKPTETKIYYDLSGYGAYQHLTNLSYVLPPGQAAVAFSCKHTSSNANKFYFDDLYVGPKLLDSEAPELLSSKAIFPNILLLEFDEPIKPLEDSQLDMALFGIGSVSTTANLCTITLYEHWEHKQKYAGAISGIEDFSHNKAPKTSFSGIAYFHGFGDVRFSEVMVDPSPVVGLPEVEYIEIFNQSHHPLQLDGWMIESDNQEFYFPSYELGAKSHLLLVASADVSKFGKVNKLGMKIPSLTNTGKTITLVNDRREVADEISYNSSWYKNTGKQEGGWSLALQDTSYHCVGEENWSASTESAGGSPGTSNAYKNLHISEQALAISEVIWHANDSIIVQFNQALEQLKNIEETNIYLSRNHILSSKWLQGNALLLVFSEAIGQEHVNVAIEVKSCHWQSSNKLEFTVAKPKDIQLGDAFFSEVLFDGDENHPEFIELFNASEQFILCSDLVLGEFNKSNGQVFNPDVLTERRVLWAPRSYLTLAEDEINLDCEGITNTDFTLHLKNDGGAIVLVDRSLNIMDEMSYSPSMHHPSLPDDEGVSLERISFFKPGRESSNWHSAASSVDYASPGCLNSQTKETTKAKATFSLSNSHISPNNDGYLDVIQLNYSLPKNGHSLSAQLYTDGGEFKGLVFDSELLNAEGALSWDGLIKGQLMSPGLYILMIECYHPSGDQLRQQIPIIINP